MAESPRDEIAKLESMYRANPEGRVFTHLAEAYRKAGDLARAREVLEDGLQRHSDSASGYVVLGRVMQDMGQPTESSTAFARVLELDPENRVALRSLGELAQAGGRTEEALARFRQLLALDPSDESVEILIAGVNAASGGAWAAPAISGEGVPFEGIPPEAEPPSAGTEAPFSGLGMETAADAPTMQLEPTPLGLPSFDPNDAAGSPEQEGAATGGAEGVGEEPFSGVAFDDIIPVEGLAAEAGASAGEQALSDLAPFAPMEGLESMGEGARIIGDETGGLPPLADFDLLPSDEPTPYPSIDQAWGLAPVVDETTESGAPPTEMVTETMADLYRSQGHLLRAAEIYRTLLRDRPGDEQLERKLLDVELAILSPSGEGVAEGAAAESAAAPAWGELPEPGPGAAPGEPADAGPAEAPVADAAASAEAGAEPVSAFMAADLSASASEAGEVPVEPPPVGEVAEPVPPAAPIPAWAEAEPVPETPAPEAELPPAVAAETPAMPAMEAVWGGGAAVAAGSESPYAWESAPAEEESGPPVALYLRSLLSWRRSADATLGGAADGAPPASVELAPEDGDSSPSAPQEAPPPAWETEAPAAESWQPEAPAPPAAWEPEAPTAQTWESEPVAPESWEPEAAAEQPEAPAAEAGQPEAAAEPPAWEPEAPAEPPAWEPEAPAEPAPWEPEATAAEPAPWEPEATAAEPPAAAPPASPEGTWAEDAADGSGDPAAGAVAPAEPASPAADSMDWLLGPTGVAPEAPATGEPARNGGAGETPTSPGDDDDLEMFRAWLQSLKK